MDTLFKNITVVTMNDSNDVLKNAYIGVDDGKIAYIGSKPPPSADGTRVIDGKNKVMMPGLVNAHTHIAMTLLRGYADDRDLQDWLFNYIFPAEEKLTPDMVYWGSALAILEMIASGTVSFSDMYFCVEETARAVAESGMKANLCRPLMCFTPEFDPKTDERYREIEALAAAWHGHDGGRIHIDAAIHAEYTSHAKVWAAGAELAGRLGLGMHVHVSETQTEHDECIARHGMTPAAALDKHGVFKARTTAAHCVWVTDEDMDILAARGVTAASCPVSNLKLRCGTARVLEMRRRGVPVALGTDGTASNNSHDLFEEIKLAAMLHQVDVNDSLKAGGALRLATRGGAAAQGRAVDMGKIALGMDADLILLDFDKPSLTPCHDVMSHLCYSARGADVCLTMVRGRVLYENGAFPTMDSERILAEANAAARIFRQP